MRKSVQLLLFILLSLIFPQHLSAQWQVANPYGGTINDIYFTNPKHGIAVGAQGGMGNCQLSAYVAKTIDGGENWVRLFLPGVSLTNLNAIDFANNQLALAAGSNSVIIRTTDGGFTWSQVSSGVGSGFNDIAFSSATQATVIGNNGIVRYSSNGGVTWNTVASNTTQSLFSVFFPNASVGYIGGSNGTFLKTTNGGATWGAVSTGTNYLFNNLFFLNAQKGFACTGNTLYATANGGTSWTAQVLPLAQIRSVHFADSLNGWVGSDAGEIGITHDGGQSWTFHHTGYYSTMDALFSIDQQRLYSTGTLGQIIFSADGGMTWESQTAGLGQEQFSTLIQKANVAWTCGKNGTLLRTKNAGMTWQRMKVPQQATFVDIAKINSEKIAVGADSGRIYLLDENTFSPIQVYQNSTFAVIGIHFSDSLHGFAIGSGNQFLRSDDGGINWSLIPNNLSNDFFRALHFINPDTGFCAGASGVFKTTDAGLNWSYYPFTNASSLQSIHFVNDSVGYCAGSFGRLMKTTDGGQLWQAIDNSTSNVNIADMSSINDSSLWFARNTSQSFTFDGGVSIASQSTFCLANNWSMNGISVGEYPDTVGFCVGGISGLIHKISYAGIDRVYISGNAYCTGSAIEIAFRGSGIVDANTTYTAQISDASGSFQNPVNIGTWSHTTILMLREGIIPAQIPSNLPTGNSYRIRVVSANPTMVSPDNGFDIQIGNSISPSVQLQNLTGPVCEGSPVSLQANTIGAGNAGNLLWLLNDSVVAQNINNYTINSFNNGDSIRVSLTSSLTCALPSQVNSSTLILNANPLPFISAGADTSVCQGSELMLSAIGQASFQWLPAGTVSNDTIANPAIIVNNPLTLILKGTLLGCSSFDTLQINSLDVPPLDYPTAFAHCQNECVNITPLFTGTFDAVQWLPAEAVSDSSILNPNVCGNQSLWLSVTLSNNNGCSETDSIFIEVLNNPSSLAPVQAADTLFSSTLGAAYLWIFQGDTIAGAQDSFYVAQQSGWYSVIVFSQEGCFSQSDSVFVLITGVTETNQTGIMVSPNPSEDFWEIRSVSFGVISEWALYDQSGRMILSQANALLPLRIDSHDLAEGLYYLKIKSQGFVSNHKLLKK